ncbi:MAG: redox-regulated ATPase YchF [Gammaproteobacteria bacterium]|nr:redox-regulated ATPase YchF [Gammaproteobacteria bacterium]|tara:strand:+ start:175888 stop:176991 length:1104 start_codon:yes stop_codon:yes gene_type:complete
MGFKCGLVGMPNVGKSSIFNLLTSQKIDAQNYPFCTIEPNTANVFVPDDRLQVLANINRSENIIHPIIEFVDIAGLIKGASKGEGLGNEFLTHIQNVDAIAHVVRFFKDDKVIHVKDNYNPIEDFSDINLELILSDISTTEKYLERIKKNKFSKKDKDKIVEELSNTLNHLNQNKFSPIINEEVLKLIPDFRLLTNKPMFIIANINSNTPNNEIVIFNKKSNIDISIVPIDVINEQEILELSEDERSEYRSGLNSEIEGVDESIINQSPLNQIIQTGYSLLELKTFYTSGEKESKAWSAKKHFNARQCSGIIHTDIEKGFIRAETIAYDDYIKYDGEQGAKNNGVWRQEGKDYVVKDGDIIFFRFNV